MKVTGSRRVGGDDLHTAVRCVVCLFTLLAVVVANVVQVSLVKLEIKEYAL